MYEFSPTLNDSVVLSRFLNDGDSLQLMWCVAFGYTVAFLDLAKS